MSQYEVLREDPIVSGTFRRWAVFGTAGFSRPDKDASMRDKLLVAHTAGLLPGPLEAGRYIVVSEWSGAQALVLVEEVPQSKLMVKPG